MLGIVDVETGGLKNNEHPITQVSIEVIDSVNFNHVAGFTSFVQPYNDLEITEKALQASRVTMAQINKGIDVKILMKELINIFKIANKSGKEATRLILVGHNVPFDLGFLEYLFYYMNKRLYDYVSRTHIDTMTLAKLKEAGSLKSSENQKFTLSACCDREGIVLHNAHGAAADVAATKKLLIKLLNNLRYANTSGSSESGGTPKNRKKAREGYFFEF